MILMILNLFRKLDMNSILGGNSSFLMKKTRILRIIYTIIFCNEYWNSWEPVSLTWLYQILGLVENINIICHVGP